MVYNFNNLVILDLANNHQGDVEHGLTIIREYGSLLKKTESSGLKGAIKLQLRNLDSIIHPSKTIQNKNSYLKRFQDTALTFGEHKQLVEEIKKQGLLVVATPFDEESVDTANKLGVDILKVASCSSADMPLISYIAKQNKPIIVSTAGLRLPELDRTVYYLKGQQIDFALLHCVAIYPTKISDMELNQIQLLKKRYPDIPIGFSSHELPGSRFGGPLAYAKGAVIFERHIGLETETHKINKYSMQLNDLRNWLSSLIIAKNSCGKDIRHPAKQEEKDALNTFKRGVYAKTTLKKGDRLKRSDVFFAMPLLEDQLPVERYNVNLITDTTIKKNQPVPNNLMLQEKKSTEETIREILLETRGLINQAHLVVNKDSKINLSHHYGLERFREYGAVVIECINREYCKKIIIQLPGQKHPYHYHKQKEEMFQLLYGDMTAILEGKEVKLDLGETLLVKPGKWHSFYTLQGGIFEEVSTTQYADDSVYDDEYININNKRKTSIGIEGLL